MLVPVFSNSSPEIIRLVVTMSVTYPLSLRNVEDLRVARGIGICYEMIRRWWNRLGPIFAADIRRNGSIGCVPIRIGAGTGRGLRED
jgi:hypothetical protein